MNHTLGIDFEAALDAAPITFRKVITHGAHLLFWELLACRNQAKGYGLKRTLHEFMSRAALITVLITISPSADIAKSTEAMLRFAETAKLVQCSPVQVAPKLNKVALIAELQGFVAHPRTFIKTPRPRSLPSSSSCS